MEKGENLTNGIDSKKMISKVITITKGRGTQLIKFILNCMKFGTKNGKEFSEFIM